MKKYLFFLSLSMLLAACSGNKSTSSSSTANAPAPSSPTPPASSTQPAQSEPQEVAGLRNVLKYDLLKDDLSSLNTNQRRFVYQEYDLNDDGLKEIFIGFPQNSYFCGSGGCTFYLLNGREAERVTRFTVTQSPFIVLKSKTNGWRDLVVYSNGSLRKLTFNGKTYPSNPSVAPAYTQTPGDGLPRLLDFDMPMPAYSF